MRSLVQTSRQRAARRSMGAAGIGTVVVAVAILFIGLVAFFGIKSLGGKGQTSNTQDNSGATIAPPLTIEKTAFSKAPKDIREAVYGYTAQNEAGCVKDGQIVDSSGNPYDQDISYALSSETSTAMTSVGCNGGNKVLFAKKDGKWQVVASDRLSLKCADLKAANVPVRLLETFNAGQPTPNSCQGDTTQDVKEYTN